MVNLYTVLVGIATDRLHHPSGSVTFDTSHALPLDVDTLLFASGNALVQFSPMLIIPVPAPLMTQLLGLLKVCCPVVLRRGGGVSVYQNDRRINLSCFCFEFGDRVDPRFYPELTDTRDGLSASSAIYYVISRRSLQSSGVIVGGDDSVS